MIAATSGIAIGLLGQSASPSPSLPPIDMAQAAPVLVTLLLVGLTSFAFWLWMLVDIFQVPTDADLRRGTKAGWTVATLIGGPPGALVYLLAARPRR